jgi:ATP-dependent Clp protease ATP-binding subunit ClpC
MDEIKRAKNIILFIDELHTIVGAGAAEGAMDASNIFKPALSAASCSASARPRSTNIASTSRRTPPSIAASSRSRSRRRRSMTPCSSCKGIRGKYEDHHKATFTDKSLEAAAKLSIATSPAVSCRTRPST